LFIIHLRILITSSPCDKCAERIIENFGFKKVYFLFNKFKNYSNTRFNNIVNVEKYIPVSQEEKKLISVMKNCWEESNMQKKDEINIFNHLITTFF